MKSKSSKEVLRRFFQFYYDDINEKISRLISDSGKEYSGIKKFNEKYINLPNKLNGMFKYYQVNASKNHHTAFSRVDRFIRTLRRMLKIHKERYPDIDWADALPNLIRYYNHTTHHSLRAGYYLNKIFYALDQVYLNPHVR